MRSSFLYNNKKLFPYRKELRNNQTEVEKLLWSKLKNKQIAHARFVRQYSIGPYILDFYCPKKRFAIELDGSQHGEQDALVYDKERTDYLKALDIRELRFWNDEIIKNLTEVLNRIYSELNT